MARGTLLLILAATAVLSASGKRTVTTTTTSDTETVTVKRGKGGTLGSAMNYKATEHRVTDLISKLDSVSGHAARAENELQATLRELWQIVDLLGKDRCGDVVERVRVLQRNMETRIEEQETELRSHRSSVIALESNLRARTAELESLQAELSSARESRTAVETELTEVRDKLSRINSKISREGSYKLVAARLEKILSLAVTRIETLERMIAMLNEDIRATNGWKKDFDAVSVSVRTLEQDFLGEGGAAETRARARIAQLEQELAIAASQRDEVARERSSMSASMERLQRRVEAGVAAGGRREKIVVTESEGGWGGMLILCFISLCTGGILVFVLSYWGTGGDAPPGVPQRSPAGSPATKFGFSPAGSRSPGFHHSKSSPMQYVHDSGGKGTTPRMQGTPRMY